MKRWEQFNQQSQIAYTLEEQAIGIYTYQILEYMENLQAGSLTNGIEKLDWRGIYRQVKAWLQEEVETKQ